MAEPTSLDIFKRDAKPTVLETGRAQIARAMQSIPPGKNAAVVVGAEWSGGLPIVSVGIARRVGDTFQLGANAQRRFERHGSSGSIWAAATWALVLLVGAAAAVRAAGEDEKYHTLTLLQAQTTSWTHVCVTGPVVYAKKQGDGDEHITLDDGRNRVVLEIVPEYPLPAPAKGQRITACGIYRWDKRHNWPEVHPVWKWTPAPR